MSIKGDFIMRTKIIALLLVFALSFCFFASCNKNKSNDNYKATVVVSFSSTDEALAEAIAKLGSTTYTVYSLDDDLKIESAIAMDGISINRVYTLSDGKIYNTTDVTAGGKTASEREKADFTPIDRADLIVSVGAGAVLDKDDFGTVTLLDENKKQKTESYVCSEIKEESRASVLSIFEKKFASLDAKVSLDGVQYYVEYKNEKIASYILNASLAVTMDGVTYNVNMSVESEYDYDAKFEIGLPEGADSYTVVRYEDIFG